MRKKLLVAFLLMTGTISFAQTREDCSYGTLTDTTINGVNVSTGGMYEYTGAADFDVPFGKIFTANQVSFNLLKGPADLPYVNINFLMENEGIPSEVIQSFDEIVPTSQELVYSFEEYSVYSITVDLPVQVVLEKGKYFLQLAAAAGDENGAWWEITNENLQNYGVFDFSKFEDEDWGGTGFYDYVFQVTGTCADSGEELPDFGEECGQGNKANDYETGVPLVAGGVVGVADDIIVAENTKFTLAGLNIQLLATGGGIHNATINIRNSVNDAPGEILESYINKGPAFEIYHGYHPFPGLPYDVVAMEIGFVFSDSIRLNEGSYFIEVIPTPNASEELFWEATSLESIGSFSYTSYDGGITWTINEGYNQVFEVNGFCDEITGTSDVNGSSEYNYYPNPVIDYLMLTSQEVVESLTIYDLTGQQIGFAKVNGITQQVDMSSFTPGIYVCRATLQDGSIENFKIIKK